MAGGELLVRGAVRLAAYFKLTPAVIGLTIVAFGTSVPELAVSAVAAWNNQTDVAVGNIVGSCIFNISFILGISAFLAPLAVSGNAIKLEYPVMLIVTMLFTVLAMDGWIGRLDAILFIIIYVSFTAYLVKVVGKSMTSEEQSQVEGEVTELAAGTGPDVWLPSVLVVSGIALLGYGADLTVAGAVEIGRFLGMSERIIGLTVVSIGTSLPEVVTSLVSTYKGRNDIAIANVIGSNIFNILGILGLTAVVSPLSVAPGILYGDNWWLLVLTFILFPIMRTGFEISKREGKFLLGYYTLYLAQLILFQK